MRSAKLCGLMLLGVLVGWFASGSLAAKAQQVPSSGRSLTAIQVGSPTGWWFVFFTGPQDRRLLASNPLSRRYGAGPWQRHRANHVKNKSRATRAPSAGRTF